MTFPIFCITHFVYGVCLGRFLTHRVRLEGSVLGWPLILTLAPVLLVSCPIGVVLSRYAGGWFFHELFAGERSLYYEQFYFGWMMLVILSASLSTFAGFVSAVSYFSRLDPKRIRWWASFFVLPMGFVLVWTFKSIYPTGILSFVTIGVFITVYWIAKKCNIETYLP